jgi:hypothetical protein
LAAAGGPCEAFAGVELEATQTQAEYPFFHGYMRAKDETLTREKWLHCIDRYEKALGFEDQPRAVSFHIDEQTGEIHPHVAWSRINTENEKYFAIGAWTHSGSVRCNGVPPRPLSNRGKGTIPTEIRPPRP